MINMMTVRLNVPDTIITSFKLGEADLLDTISCPGELRYIESIHKNFFTFPIFLNSFSAYPSEDVSNKSNIIEIGPALLALHINLY